MNKNDIIDAVFDDLLNMSSEELLEELEKHQDGDVAKSLEEIAYFDLFELNPILYKNLYLIESSNKKYVTPKRSLSYSFTQQDKVILQPESPVEVLSGSMSDISFNRSYDIILSYNSVKRESKKRYFCDDYFEDSNEDSNIETDYPFAA